MKFAAFPVLVLGAFPLDAAGVVLKAGSAIEPELDPETHKEWEKDYPIDVNHRLPLKLKKQPYPSVQEADTFDKDYVKDENNNKMDKKTWDEQLAYGKKVSDAAEDVDKLKNKLKDLEKELEDAKKKESEEEQEYEDAKKDVGDAPVHEEKDFGEVPDVSTKEVEKEVGDLEKCKEELRKAKEELERLEKEAQEAHLVEEKAENVKVDAVQFERVAEEKHEEAVKKVEEEKTEYDKAVRTHAEEAAILEKMEMELKEAEEKLRKFRGGGGSQDPLRSAATSSWRGGSMKALMSTILLISYVATA